MTGTFVIFAAYHMQAQKGRSGHTRVLPDSSQLCGNIPDCMELLCSCNGVLDPLQSSAVCMDCRYGSSPMHFRGQDPYDDPADVAELASSCKLVLLLRAYA